MGFIIKEIDAGDLTYYDSLETAAAALEAIDVEHGEYEGFDEAGRQLSITADAGAVSISLSEDAPLRAGDLKSSLVREVLGYGHLGRVARLVEIERRVPTGPWWVGSGGEVKLRG